MILNNVNNSDKIRELEYRLENLLSLPAGSTTADAELKDIRVGANGVVYYSAGQAVRQQFNIVKGMCKDIGMIAENTSDQINGVTVSEEYNEWVNGIIDSSTGELITEDVYNYSTDYILLSAGDSIILTECPESSKLKVYSYDVDTQAFIGLVATLKEPEYENNKIYTATEDVLVRCSDDGSGTFRIQVTSVTAGILKRLEALEKFIADIENGNEVEY